MDDSAEPPSGPGHVAGDVDRLEALEQQVRQLTSRLAGWVEGQLIQALEDRRTDMKVLRSELQVVVDEQLAGMRAETSSMIAVATRRLDDVQERLAERLQDVAGRTAERSSGAEGLEQRVRAAMSRLSESVESKLAQVTTARGTELEALRSEVASTAAALTERLDAVAQQATSAVETVSRAQAGGDADTARIDAFEQRVKAGMGRVTEVVETRLAEWTASHQSDAEALRSDVQKALAQQATELRTEIGAAATGLRTRAGQTDERVEALEHQYRDAGDRTGRMVEAKLAEVVERRQGELEEMKFELQEVLAKQLSEARSEIGTAVADAHQRFVASLEHLEQRMTTLQETVGSDGRRVEALELHTRRTDARLTELVEAKLGELAAHRSAELEEVRGQLSTALDAHLAEVRAEVAAALGEGRKELAAVAAQLDERRATLDRRAAEAVASLDALGASVEGALREAEERLGERIHAKLTGFEAAAAQVHESRAEVAATATSLGRKAARAQEQMDKKLHALSEQVDAVAASATKARATEAGALAPVRSDVRLLQAQVAELAAAVAELPSVRKAQAAAAKAASGTPARRSAPAAKASKARPVKPTKPTKSVRSRPAAQ